MTDFEDGERLSDCRRHLTKPRKIVVTQDLRGTMRSQNIIVHATEWRSVRRVSGGVRSPPPIRPRRLYLSCLVVVAAAAASCLLCRSSCNKTTVRRRAECQTCASFFLRASSSACSLFDRVAPATGATYVPMCAFKCTQQTKQWTHCCVTSVPAGASLTSVLGRARQMLSSCFNFQLSLFVFSYNRTTVTCDKVATVSVPIITSSLRTNE